MWTEPATHRCRRVHGLGVAGPRAEERASELRALPVSARAVHRGRRRPRDRGHEVDTGRHFSWASRWAMCNSDFMGAPGSLQFPTQDQVRDFSTARIDPSSMRRSTCVAVSARRTREQGFDFGLGGGMVYFRGSQERRNLDSVDADYVVLDEYDMFVQENVPDAERRVSGPLSAGLIRRVGVPTVPGSGIAQSTTSPIAANGMSSARRATSGRPLTSSRTSIRSA